MKSLTGRQSEIYQFIVEWREKNGFPPTQEEIRGHFRYRSLNTVRDHLKSIEKKGYFRLDPGKARGIHLVEKKPRLSRSTENSIPLLGKIAAGRPMWAEQNIEDHLPIPPALFGKGELFALYVTGDSMTGAGIRDGDIAILERRERVENGEIGAVLIDGDATLKRVYSTPGSLILKAENPSYQDLEVDGGNCDVVRVLGRYRGIVRTENNRWRP